MEPFIRDFSLPVILVLAYAICYDRTRNRTRQRILTLLSFSLVGGWFIFLGDSWLINRHLPIKYLGFILIAVVIMAICGINVWYGGPLDMRKKDTEESDN